MHFSGGHLVANGKHPQASRPISLTALAGNAPNASNIRERVDRSMPFTAAIILGNASAQ